MSNVNYNKAREWHEKAAELGKGEAFKRLGDFYYKGLGVKEDLHIAFSYYDKAIKAGCKQAEENYYLIKTHLDNENLKITNGIKKRRLFFFCSAVSLAVIFAVLLFWGINSIHSDDDAVPQIDPGINETKETAKVDPPENDIKEDKDAGDLVDIGLPVKVHKKSVSNSYIRASLGDKHYSNDDFSEAYTSYKDSADKGNSYAMVEIGKMYRDGKGVEADVNEAERWFLRASEKNNAYAFYYLGKLYEESKNEKAFECYRQAETLGCKEAHFDLGRFNEEGKGIQGSDPLLMAEEEYEKALEVGDSRAKKRLAFLLIKLGDRASSRKDKASEYYERAFKLLKELAGKNDSDALLELGKLYERGKGVKMNKKEAAKCYSNSAALGNKIAKSKLKYLKQ